MSDRAEPRDRNDVAQTMRAAAFAARAHRTQRRKGEDGDPYVNHVVEVAERLARATGDTPLVIAGLLHDTVEDCETEPAEIEAAFGAEVASLVAEVTDDKSLPKAERKRQQIEHAAEISERARMLKIADKTSNLRGIGASPGIGWPVERRRAYVEWADAVVARCRGLNAELDAAYDETRAATLRAIEGAAA